MKGLEKLEGNKIKQEIMQSTTGQGKSIDMMKNKAIQCFKEEIENFDFDKYSMRLMGDCFVDSENMKKDLLKKLEEIEG